MNWTRKTLHRISHSGFLAVLSGAVLLCSSASAADPFRSGTGARPMGAALENAFEDFFRTGSYLNSTQKLSEAQAENPREPLVYSLQAALAYFNGQPSQVQVLGQRIQQVAQSLQVKDSARSHLYRGIGKGFEGASLYLKDKNLGIIKALPYLSSMIFEIDKAHQLAPNDPEINLVSGYVEMVLATQKLKSYSDALSSFRRAAPAYLAYRGQALVYRDTKNYPQAQTMVGKALKEAPRNPDLFYLKSQILALQKRPVDAVASFDQALALGKQLPESVKKQIRRERTVQLSKVAQSPL